eukprot:755432-Hanusia_phi.AAC.3
MEKHVDQPSSGMDHPAPNAQGQQANEHVNLGELEDHCSQEDIASMFSSHDDYSFPALCNRHGQMLENVYPQEVQVANPAPATSLQSIASSSTLAGSARDHSHARTTEQTGSPWQNQSVEELPSVIHRVISRRQAC